MGNVALPEVNGQTVIYIMISWYKFKTHEDSLLGRREHANTVSLRVVTQTQILNGQKCLLSAMHLCW